MKRSVTENSEDMNTGHTHTNKIRKILFRNAQDFGFDDQNDAASSVEVNKVRNVKKARRSASYHFSGQRLHNRKFT